MRALLFLFTIGLLAPPAPACTVPPGEYFRTLDTLVSDSTYVVLATFNRREPIPLPDWCSPNMRAAERAKAIAHLEVDDGEALLTFGRRYESECMLASQDFFELEETLSGTAPEPLVLAFPTTRSSNESTLANHAAWSAFLESPSSINLEPPRWGRVHVSPDCGLYPDFEIGATYLLFGGPPHVLSYERIQSKGEDLWLAAVRLAIGTSKKARRITSP